MADERTSPTHAERWGIRTEPTVYQIRKIIRFDSYCLYRTGHYCHSAFYPRVEGSLGLINGAAVSAAIASLPAHKASQLV